MKTKIFMAGFTLLLAAAFCISAPTASAMSAAPGIYRFFGRVTNQEDKPVGNCSVLLVKRLTHKEAQQNGEEGGKKEKQYTVTSEEVVAVTDNDGNYLFSFEPLTADNFWVFFSAAGYRSREVELNSLMRSRFFKKPNKSPIKLDMVLEKE